MRGIRVLMLFFCAVSLLASCNGLKTVTIKGHELKVEIADSDSERRKGLMYRDSLPEDRGMLFVYPFARKVSFWMMNTGIPLSAAYIKSDGTISEIIDLVPYDKTSRPSKEAVKFIIEVNRGWFDERGIRPGDRVELPY